MTVSFGPSGEIHGESLTLLPSAARTAGGTGAGKLAGSHDTARLTLDVTAVSGTSPTTTVTLEHSGDRSTWRTHSAFDAATAVSTQRKVFSGLDQYVRVTWTMGGTTPNITFSVTGYLV